MATRRIPVIVLAGFLGAGKTTLLNHLLRHSRGTRIGAVVNDFGSIEIDAMTVAGQVDSMVSLGDGCLCCAVDTEDLDGALERLAHPSARMDVIVVEASGLAEPETLIRMILASSSEHIVYGGLAEVVDAAEIDGTRERHPELDRHIRAADLVVLNKADRVDEAGRRRLSATLQELSPGTPVIPAAYGRVDPGLFFDPSRRPRPAVEQLSFDELLWDDVPGVDGHRPHGHGTDGPDGHGTGLDCHGGCSGGGDHSGHLHAAYESVDFTSHEPLDPRRFLEFLDDRPAGLYRMKGRVDFGPADPDHVYTVHAVGGFLRFTPGERPRRGTSDADATDATTQLVLIGSGIDADELRARLAASVTTGPTGDAAADQRAMWGILRYVTPDTASRPVPDAATGAADDDPDDSGDPMDALDEADLPSPVAETVPTDRGRGA